MKVTYFLGAGSSFHSMPLLNTMTSRLEVFGDFIFHKMQLKAIPEEPTKFYLDRLNDLIFNVKDSTSIDNYACELYNSNNIASLRKLRYLKLILTGYFLFEQ